MGSSLISAVIEINKQPDWAAAEKYILNLSDLQVLNYYSDILGLGDEYCDEDMEELSSQDYDASSDLPKHIKNARNALLQSLQDCKDGYEGYHRQMNKIHLRDSIILLAAGESWGDNVEQCDSIFLFDGCGAAKAAGFF